MTGRLFRRMAARYGGPVSIRGPEGGELLAVSGFLRPAPETVGGGGALCPTPLGWADRTRFFYFGAAEGDLQAVFGTYLRIGGVDYDIEHAQAVVWGGCVHHWWAVVRVREGAAV